MKSNVAGKSKKRGGVAFLLGAGASSDAQLPSAFKMIEYLKDYLGEVWRPVLDICLSDHIVPRSPDEKKELMSTLNSVLRKRKKSDIDIETLVEQLGRRASKGDHGAQRLWQLIYGLAPLWLQTPPPSQLEYLQWLSAFIPHKGRLEIFSLNHDCCLEVALQCAGVRFTTGFSPRWSPQTFKSGNYEVDLYKLHGSTSWLDADTKEKWFESPPEHLSYKRMMQFEEVNIWDYEWAAGGYNGTTVDKYAAMNLLKQPRGIIFAHTQKVKMWEPFYTLWTAFKKALETKLLFVVIGYSWRDRHINEAFKQHMHTGLRLINVNPNAPQWAPWGQISISHGAKELTTGLLFLRFQRIVRGFLKLHADTLELTKLCGLDIGSARIRLAKPWEER